MLSLREKPIILIIKAWFKDVKNTRSYLLTVFALSITVILVFSENINKYITITSMKHFSLQSWLLHENKITMLRDLMKTMMRSGIIYLPSQWFWSGTQRLHWFGTAGGEQTLQVRENSVTNLILFLLVRSII